MSEASVANIAAKSLSLMACPSIKFSTGKEFAINLINPVDNNQFSANIERVLSSMSPFLGGNGRGMSRRRRLS